jgi:hypothetical protein
MPYLAFAVGFAVALVIVGLAGALALERARRLDLARTVGELRERLSALERVDRNPLYRESMEDMRARELRAADSAAVGVEHMLHAIRLLAPEMLKKGKNK